MLKKNYATIFWVFIFCVGLCIMSYPAISNWVNSRSQSRVIAGYDNAVDSLSEDDSTKYFKEAQAYNESLHHLGSAEAFREPELLEDYEDTLDITGTGIMGYVSIEKIDVKLPIYHGTGQDVLSSGAGHMQGTSLPVGGENTHSVISAHRGLPNSTLFSNLNQMEKGDIFTITVLGRVFMYRVDQVIVVLPTEVEYLYVEEGKDYVTLLTCTPYGINTHRLLVRGVRVETEESFQPIVAADANRMSSLWAAPVIAMPIFAVLLIWLFLDSNNRGRKNNVELEEFLNEIYKKM